MKATQKIVRELLETNPATRDNDYLLMVTIWKQQANLLNFFSKFVSGQLVSPESIRRARQRVQQVHAELRGTKYEIRQQQQKKIKEALGYKV